MDEGLEGDEMDLPSIREHPVRPTPVAEFDRQTPFWNLFKKFDELYSNLPNLSMREVDAKIVELYDQVVDAATMAGISRMSVAKLQCCGKTRTWTEVNDPGKSQVMPAQNSEKKFKLGDTLKKIFSWLGFKPCDGCERRRRWLNRIGWGKKQ